MILINVITSQRKHDGTSALVEVAYLSNANAYNWVEDAQGRSSNRNYQFKVIPTPVADWGDTTDIPITKYLVVGPSNGHVRLVADSYEEADKRIRDHVDEVTSVSVTVHGSTVFLTDCGVFIIIPIVEGQWTE